MATNILHMKQIATSVGMNVIFWLYSFLQSIVLNKFYQYLVIKESEYKILANMKYDNKNLLLA